MLKMSNLSSGVGDRKQSPETDSANLESHFLDI